MPRHRQSALLARAALVAALLAAVAASPAEAAPRTVPPGLRRRQPRRPDDRARVAATRAGAPQGAAQRASGYVRAPMPWWYMEPRRPASTDRRDVDGGVNFTYTDQFVLAAARAGLRVLPVVGRGTPDWASGNPFSQSPCRPATPPTSRASWGRSCAATGRPGGSGASTRTSGRSPIRAWQIWNEPDLQAVLGRHALGAALRPAAARRPIAPCSAPTRGREVVAAALTNRSWEDLAALYDAGARGSFDAVAIHPYTATVGGVVSSCGGRARVMRAHGDAPQVPLLVTELGWPATDGAPEPRFAISTNAQGQRRAARAVAAQADAAARRSCGSRRCASTPGSRPTPARWGSSATRACAA